MAIRYEQGDHIVTITIDRYEVRNALDLEHWHQLATSWKRFRDDPDAWVAIITGVRDAFCAGGDLKTFIPIYMQATAEGRTEIDGVPLSCAHEGTLRGLHVYKPIIAAVNGFCMAGGMEMLGGTDIRIAGESATFEVSEPKRGLIAAGGTTSRLPRQIGWPAAMEVLLTADRFSAQRAAELGLVNEVVPDGTVLDRALWWARRITKNAPLAVSATKESALRGFEAAGYAEAAQIEQELSARIKTSKDAIEGPAAFAEKREPRWSGT